MTHTQRLLLGTGSILVIAVMCLGFFVSQASAARRDPTTPTNTAFVINDGATCTTDQEVELTYWADNAFRVRTSLSEDFTGSEWSTFDAQDAYYVMLPGVDGSHDVYAQFQGRSGDRSEPIMQSVVLDTYYGCFLDDLERIFDPLTEVLERYVSPEAAGFFNDFENIDDDSLEEWILLMEEELGPLLEDEAFLAELEEAALEIERSLDEFYGEDWDDYEDFWDEDWDEEFDDELYFKNDLWEEELDLSLPETLDTGDLYPGDLVRAQTAPGVYEISEDGERRLFANEEIFDSWYYDESDVIVLSDSVFVRIPEGPQMTVAPGSFIKTESDVAVWMVGEGETVQHVFDESVAIELYGADWPNYVIDVTPDQLDQYRVLPTLR